MKNAKYIEVKAEVRYWEDATVNGVDDDAGTMIPFRLGNLWMPVVRLDDGQIIGWPEGVESDIHYKVCDTGEYWLQDANRNRIAKWRGDYVPDDLLCVGDQSYGDYIIFKVGSDGKIKDWQFAGLTAEQTEQWEAIPVDIALCKAVKDVLAERHRQ